MNSDQLLLERFFSKVDIEKNMLVEKKKDLPIEQANDKPREEEAWESFVKEYVDKPLAPCHVSTRYGFDKLLEITPASNEKNFPSVAWSLPIPDWSNDDFPCFAFRINLIFLQWVEDQVNFLNSFEIKLAVQENCIMNYQYFFEKHLPKTAEVLKGGWVKEMESAKKGSSKSGSSSKKKSLQSLEKKKQKRELKKQAKIEAHKEYMIAKYGDHPVISTQLPLVFEHPEQVLNHARYEKNYQTILKYAERFEPLFTRESAKLKMASQDSFLKIYKQSPSLDHAKKTVERLVEDSCLKPK
jgi:hypothetical protein